MSLPSQQEINRLFAQLRLVAPGPQAQEAIQALRLAVLDLQVEVEAVERVADMGGVPAVEGGGEVALSMRVLRLKHLAESAPERQRELRAEWQRQSLGESLETALVLRVQCPHCLEVGHAAVDCPETLGGPAEVPPPAYVVKLPWPRCDYCHHQHDASLCPRMLAEVMETT